MSPEAASFVAPHLTSARCGGGSQRSPRKKPKALLPWAESTNEEVEETIVGLGHRALEVPTLTPMKCSVVGSMLHRNIPTSSD
jgi:hypothetical protein